MQSRGKERLRSDSTTRPCDRPKSWTAAEDLPAAYDDDEIQNQATGFGAECTSCAGTSQQEKNRLTLQPLSGMTDLCHFRLSPDAIDTCISPQFGRVPLRAQVKPLRAQVTSTQARNGVWANLHRSRPPKLQSASQIRPEGNARFCPSAAGRKDAVPFGPPFARVAFTGGSRGCGPASRRGRRSRLAAIRQEMPSGPTFARVAGMGGSRVVRPGVATWARGRRLPDRSLSVAHSGALRFFRPIGFAESGQGPPNPGSSLGPQVQNSHGRPQDGEQGNGGPTDVVVPPGSSQFGLEGCRNNVRQRATEPSENPERQQDL